MYLVGYYKGLIEDSFRAVCGAPGDRGVRRGPKDARVCPPHMLTAAGSSKLSGDCPQPCEDKSLAGSGYCAAPVT